MVDVFFWSLAACVGFVMFLIALYAVTQTVIFAYLFAHKRFHESQQTGESDDDS